MYVFGILKALSFHVLKYRVNYYIMIIWHKRCSSHEICMWCVTTERIDTVGLQALCCVRLCLWIRTKWVSWVTCPDPSTLKVGIHRQVFNVETVTTLGGDAFTDNYLGRLEFLFEGDQVCPHTWVYIYAISSFCVLYAYVLDSLQYTELLSLSSSTQLGSYFGGTVAAVDVNGDGWVWQCDHHFERWGSSSSPRWHSHFSCLLV